MKVLMTADAVGGVLTYALELSSGLAERDVDVVLVLTGPPPSGEQRRRIAGTPLAGYAERPYALEWMPSPWDDLDRTASWLLELFEVAEPDVVHLNGFVHGTLPLPAPKLVVGHSCVLSWHEAVRRAPAGPEWSRYRSAVADGLRGADALVAPTRALLGELERLYAPRCLRETIPNGLAPAALAPRRKQPYAIGLGRVWDEAKNLHALERVRDRVRWPLLVAGEGSALGRVDSERVHELLDEAAVFAEPARYEPFGLAALEAALCGCALVLGDIPTLREVWADAAVYVDPFDDDALADALNHVLANESERERLAGAARARASTYSRERMASAYLDLYERLLTGVADSSGRLAGVA